MKKNMVKRAALGHIKRSDQSVEDRDGSYEMIMVTGSSPVNKEHDHAANGSVETNGLVLPPKFVNSAAHM